eukprot:TRINITY_DN2882_c0_g1_i1.p1 TRINITY_DN2882_c0_g1~~TRINITY_DN2882_c0_g1_i1.p1  ORF type:complete len:509 (-),score=122.27 TRINITY_DN2882_c0_g1_i1:178-1704(-)
MALSTWAKARAQAARMKPKDDYQLSLLSKRIYVRLVKKLRQKQSIDGKAAPKAAPRPPRADAVPKAAPKAAPRPPRADAVPKAKLTTAVVKRKTKEEPTATALAEAVLAVKEAVAFMKRPASALDAVGPTLLEDSSMTPTVTSTAPLEKTSLVSQIFERSTMEDEELGSMMRKPAAALEPASSSRRKPAAKSPVAWEENVSIMRRPATAPVAVVAPQQKEVFEEVAAAMSEISSIVRKPAAAPAVAGIPQPKVVPVVKKPAAPPEAVEEPVAVKKRPAAVPFVAPAPQPKEPAMMKKPAAMPEAASAPQPKATPQPAAKPAQSMWGQARALALNETQDPHDMDLLTKRIYSKMRLAVRAQAQAALPVAKATKASTPAAVKIHTAPAMKESTARAMKVTTMKRGRKPIAVTKTPKAMIAMRVAKSVQSKRVQKEIKVVPAKAAKAAPKVSVWGLARAEAEKQKPKDPHDVDLLTKRIYSKMRAAAKAEGKDPQELLLTKRVYVTSKAAT